MTRRARQQAQFSAFYVAIAVVVLVLLQSWLLAPRVQEIPMSQLIERVREDKVARVSFGEREIRGELKQAPPAAESGVPDWLERLTGSRQSPLLQAVAMHGHKALPFPKVAGTTS